MNAAQKSNLQKGETEYFLLYPLNDLRSALLPGSACPMCHLMMPEMMAWVTPRLSPTLTVLLCFRRHDRRHQSACFPSWLGFFVALGSRSRLSWPLSGYEPCHTLFSATLAWCGGGWGETYQTKLQGLTEIIPSELFHYVPSETERLNLLLTRGFISSHIALGEASCCST